VYQSLYAQQYAHFRELARLFYASNRTIESYFWEVRRILDDDSITPREAFVRATAGQSVKGYERVVLDRGELPPEFASAVRALENAHADRGRRAEELLGPARSGDLVPVLARMEEAGIAMDTSVNIVFKNITGSFGLPQSTIQWVIISYVLFYGSLLTVFGKLGDVRGHLLVFRVGLLLSTITLLLFYWQPGFSFLLLLRIAQGVDVARRAGRYAASPPTSVMNATAPTKTAGSNGLTLNSTDAINFDNDVAAARPGLFGSRLRSVIR
jgi:hypothetical protein